MKGRVYSFFGFFPEDSIRSRRSTELVVKLTEVAPRIGDEGFVGIRLPPVRYCE